MHKHVILKAAAFPMRDESETIRHALDALHHDFRSWLQLDEDSYSWLAYVASDVAIIGFSAGELTEIHVQATFSRDELGGFHFSDGKLVEPMLVYKPIEF